MSAAIDKIRKDFSEWIAEVIEPYDTQGEAAHALGLKQHNLSRYKDGKVAPPLATMQAIAKRAKRPLPASLINREDSPPVLSIETRSKRFVSFRREARAIAAGDPIDDPEGPDEGGAYAFSLDWFKHRFGFEPSENSKRFHLFRIAKDENGDSMEPTIPRGSIVLMDREGAQEEGAIYVVRHPELGGLMCKRVFKSRDGLVLESDNRAHRPIVVRMDHDRSWDGARKYVLGRVVWVGFEL